MTPKFNTRTLTKETRDIIITKYKKEYYSDFVEAGHYLHLHDFFKPDVRGRIKQFANRTFFLNQEEITLAAYSEKDKKAVGSIKARKITDSLWGVWNIFVLPAYRGRRIGSLLLKETVHYLRGKKVDKLISHVAKTNISSIRHSRRSGWRSLSNRIFKCERIGPIIEHETGKTTVRKLRRAEKRQLFDVFELCVGRQWCSYLEIDWENYLDRICGPALWEEYGLLSKVAMKKDVMVAERGGESQGYAISRTLRLFNDDYATHLLVPMSKGFNTICKSLLLKAFRPSNQKKQNKFSFIYIGDKESRKHIEELGFEIQEFLVQGLQL